MLLQDYQLEMINGEISKSEYNSLTDQEITDKLNSTQTITNTIPRGTIPVYNATSNTSPKIHITDFINLISIAELVAAKNDPNGLILYERLMALEIMGTFINLTDPLVVYGVISAVSDGWLSTETADALTGFTELSDPAYQSTFEVESLAVQLIFRPITLAEIMSAKGI